MADMEADSFNGATAMKPWKSADHCRSRGATQLQWGHGDEAVEESLTTRHARPDGVDFNGATAMKPWKS